MPIRMCLYIRLLGSLVKNLVTRLISELADCLAALKRFLFYRICCCICKAEQDDVGTEEVEDCDTTPNAEENDQQPSPYHQVDNLPEALKKYAWFHTVDRRTAQEMVHDGGQGCFLVRPSGSGQYPLTLTLWHRNRAFNILIRIREDGLCALGTKKENEPAFQSVGQLIRHYHIDELLLVSHGDKAGKTLLITSPVRQHVEEV